MTISRVKFPWPPFFRIFIFFDEIFISVCGTPAKLVDPFSAGTATIGVAGSRVPAAVWGDSIAPQCGPVVQL